MARWLARSLALCAFGLLVLAPAGAADQSVMTTAGSAFNPRTVNIAPGETVTWSNPSGGFHNVKFDDGSFEMPAQPEATTWSVPRRFDQPGSFRYFCEFHGAPGGVGMSGTVVVAGAGGGPAPDTTEPEVEDLRASPSPFCNGPSRVCDERGTRFRFRLSEDADVEITMKRRGFSRSFEREGKRGSNAIRFSGRGLDPARYALTVVATDAAGNESDPARAKFTVRRAG